MLFKLFSILKNKYTLTFIGLITWIVFFDKNDVFSQLELTKKLTLLESEKNYFVTEIQKNKQDLLELKTNPKNLEKFARERYLMKKDNEDLFVIVQETASDTAR